MKMKFIFIRNFGKVNSVKILMLLFQCLFDSIINTQLTQVIIPFDASLDPKDIKDHVMSTVSRVVAKVSIP